jgi:hypothetical protein
LKPLTNNTDMQCTLFYSQRRFIAKSLFPQVVLFLTYKITFNHILCHIHFYSKCISDDITVLYAKINDCLRRQNSSLNIQINFSFWIWDIYIGHTQIGSLPMVNVKLIANTAVPCQLWGLAKV